MVRPYNVARILLFPFTRRAARVEWMTTIDSALVRALIADQFPQWAHLPVAPVEYGGWDNRTFHLGDRMSVRLPSAPGYVGQVEKEQRWLPVLAPQLPLPIPAPLGAGRPSTLFPHPWSVYGWIDGTPAIARPPRNLVEFADDVARFLVALRAADATGGPPPGEHNFFRGASPAHYDDQTRVAIRELDGRIDAPLATAAWEHALAATFTGAPVWFHGDIAVGNLLLDDSGRLCAVIDFGTSGVGDPACDLALAFNSLEGESRRVYRERLGVDDATWSRGRGWALWKALIVVAGSPAPPAETARQRRVIDEVLEDFAESA